MPDSHKKTPTVRALAFGVFLILFGIALGAMTYLTIVGPFFGVLLIAFGIYIIWTSSAHGEPPGPIS